MKRGEARTSRLALSWNGTATTIARLPRIVDIRDIVKCPFPYANRPVLQRRPALVVSDHAAAGAPALLWVLMVTSATHRRWDGDIEIDDLADAGLPSGSIVRSAEIATIEAADAVAIGRLSLADQATVRSVIRQIVEPMLSA